MAINRLAQVLSCHFDAVQLKNGVPRETVADIVVRISSQGVKLSSTDFILTWYGVWGECGLWVGDWSCDTTLPEPEPYPSMLSSASIGANSSERADDLISALSAVLDPCDPRGSTIR